MCKGIKDILELEYGEENDKRNYAISVPKSVARAIPKLGKVDKYDKVKTW